MLLKKYISAILRTREGKIIEDRLELALVPYVPFLKDADPELVADLVAAIESVKYREGEEIVREGEPGDTLYFVVEGAVKITREGKFLATLGVGGCFGEAALMGDGIRAATVVASEKVTLFRINRESYLELTEKHLVMRFRLNELRKQREAKNIENSIQQNLLKSTPFLNGAGGGLINELARYLEPINYKEGDVLIREGEVGTSFFLIEEGSVGVSKAGVQITELGLGACLGEGSLFTDDPCSATVTALADTSCFVLKKAAFNRIIRRYPVFGKKLLAVYTARG
ncbi:MAG: cyclic nucleotide-binding domain-containing protein [Opitutaceae bacterium]